MLKLNKSFSVFIMKGKHRFLLLFISFCSSSVAFIHIDWPFILSQLLIFFRSIILSNPYILLLIRAFLKSFNSLHVMSNSSVLSVMDAGNNIPNGVNLYITFYLNRDKSTNNFKILLGAYYDRFNRFLHW